MYLHLYPLILDDLAFVIVQLSGIEDFFFICNSLQVFLVKLMFFKSLIFLKPSKNVKIIFFFFFQKLIVLITLILVSNPIF